MKRVTLMNDLTQQNTMIASSPVACSTQERNLRWIDQNL